MRVLCVQAPVRGVQHDPITGDSSIAVNLMQRFDGASPGDITEGFSGEEGPVSSTASSGPWGHSIYSPLRYIVSTTVLHRGQRSTLTRHSLSPTLPQVQSVPNPSAFGVKFQKCAQVVLGVDPPQMAFSLVIHNLDRAGGADLSQVAIRDSISGIVPLESAGKVVETDYQTFALDSLPAGSQHVVNYTAKIRNQKSQVLYLPAFLSFSNASQNDVQMFGPLLANLTLRVNNTDQSGPSSGLHVAGFVGGFLVAVVMFSLGFLAVNLFCAQTRFNLLHKRNNRDESDPEYADWSLSESLKDEAAFEDKMVDIMVLEDHQNMYQALESLEMSSLLRASTHLESNRVQVYKDLTVSLLGGLGCCPGRGGGAQEAQQRLLNVLHGQLLGMEGRLREEQVARMAALAGRCNLETREEMEAECRREEAEKTAAEQLFRHTDPQEFRHCSVLLEKLQKLHQGGVQRALLARHEEASAGVRRRLTEWRRAELHKIFCEELEEATRMGEMEKSTAKSLQHDYFACQDQLEEALDVVVANQRYMLAERHAQRRFLVHSLHSLKSLISDTFSSSSSGLGCWFNQVRRESTLPGEQLDQLQDKAQQELLMVRQRLEDKLNGDRRAMHSVLVKKRRELITDMLQIHNQRRRELSDISKEGLVGRPEVTMRVIQSSMVEVKAIQPTAVQALLNAQEKLHQEGKAAVRTLRCTREALQEAMDRELREQKERRASGRAFFRCLCSCQLMLSEDDTLRMKLEFYKCLSVMDRCLVLPHAASRAKLHAALVAWRKEEELQADNTQSEHKPRSSKGKSKNDSQHKAEPAASVLLLYQRRLEERIQVFEKEKGMQHRLMDQADGLAMQMAAIHYGKAETRTRALETSGAMLTLQRQLTRQLRERRGLERGDMARSILHHCSSLEEAEQRLQEERTGLGHSDAPCPDQEALCKQYGVFATLTERLREANARSQVVEDLKEQLELKRLYAHCDQELEFASRLVEQGRVPTEVLLEALRLLLPTLPEAELLPLVEALRRPKHTLTSASSSSPVEQARPGLQVKRRHIQEKLFSHTAPPPASQPLPAMLLDQPPVAELTPTQQQPPQHPPPNATPAAHAGSKAGSCSSPSPPPATTTTTVTPTYDHHHHHHPSPDPSTGERLFVFRAPPPEEEESRHDAVGLPRRKKKRNFLNMKKSSVAPSSQP
ncbi:hypothetical protein NHX12_030899 [Muraenolepis orangiensis]|uniref:Limbin n=1 Tax=Muraenolepis orangiensis TaxID=630683 RepID=A0A9Q0EAE6_9TELE|nr:hypothetical protein NHX12_030899 [Muraenolepis orangiensis]